MVNSWLLIVPWVLVVTGGVVTAWGGWRVIERLRSRRRQRACPKCAYDMHATRDLRCPECGFTTTRESAFRRRRVPWVRWALGIACVVLGSAVLPLRLHDPNGRVQRLPDWVIAGAMMREDRPLPGVRNPVHGWAWEEGMSRWRTDRFGAVNQGVTIDFETDGTLRVPRASAVPVVPADRLTRGLLARALTRYAAQCDADGTFGRMSFEYWTCAPVSAAYRDLVMRRIELPHPSMSSVSAQIVQRFAMGTVSEADERRILAVLAAPDVSQKDDLAVAALLRHLAEREAGAVPAVILTEALGLSSHLVRVAAAAWARSDAARLERVGQIWRDRLADADPARRAAAVMAWSTLHPSDVLVARELAPIAAGDDDLGVALNALAALRLMTRDAQREGIGALAEADIQHEAIRRVVAELMQPPVFAEPLSRRMQARRAVQSDRFAGRIEHFDDVRLPMGTVEVERDAAERLVVRFTLPPNDIPPRWWSDHAFRDAQLRAVYDELCAQARADGDARRDVIAVFRLLGAEVPIGPAFVGDDPWPLVSDRRDVHAYPRSVGGSHPPEPMELRYDVRVWDARPEPAGVLNGHVIVTNHGNVPVTHARADLRAQLVEAVGGAREGGFTFRTSREFTIAPGDSIALAWQRASNRRSEPMAAGMNLIECTGRWTCTPRCVPALVMIPPSAFDARQRLVRLGGDRSGFTLIRRDGVAERFDADGRVQQRVRIDGEMLHVVRQSNERLWLTRDGRFVGLGSPAGIAIRDLDRAGAPEIGRLPSNSQLVSFDDARMVRARVFDTTHDDGRWVLVTMDLTTGTSVASWGSREQMYVRPDGGAHLRGGYRDPVAVHVGALDDPDLPVTWMLGETLYPNSRRVDLRDKVRRSPRDWTVNQSVSLAPVGILRRDRTGVTSYAWADGAAKWTVAQRGDDPRSGGLLVMDAVGDRVLLAQVHGQWVVTELLLVDATDGTIIATLPHDGRINAMFSGDGADVFVTAYDEALFAGEFGRTVVIHDAATGERVREVTLAAPNEE